MSRRVRIYGLDYWPDETGIAPYTTAFADQHTENGGDGVGNVSPRLYTSTCGDDGALLWYAWPLMFAAMLPPNVAWIGT